AVPGVRDAQLGRVDGREGVVVAGRGVEIGVVVVSRADGRGSGERVMGYLNLFFFYFPDAYRTGPGLAVVAGGGSLPMVGAYR
ncbi:hypothetical protein, partial [Nocardia cyriacigeorgica]|uniref:hypothetical protein n=1 Tax=Nocardia cyriacigeorgica TaxID=135487 RepID=UPI0024544F3D